MALSTRSCLYYFFQAVSSVQLLWVNWLVISLLPGSSSVLRWKIRVKAVTLLSSSFFHISLHQKSAKFYTKGLPRAYLTRTQQPPLFYSLCWMVSLQSNYFCQFFKEKLFLRWMKPSQKNCRADINMLWCQITSGCWAKGWGHRDPLRSLPAWAVLQFCDKTQESTWS